MSLTENWFFQDQRVEHLVKHKVSIYLIAIILCAKKFCGLFCYFRLLITFQLPLSTARHRQPLATPTYTLTQVASVSHTHWCQLQSHHVPWLPEPNNHNLSSIVEPFNILSRTPNILIPNKMYPILELLQRLLQIFQTLFLIPRATCTRLLTKPELKFSEAVTISCELYVLRTYRLVPLGTSCFTSNTNLSPDEREVRPPWSDAWMFLDNFLYFWCANEAEHDQGIHYDQRLYGVSYMMFPSRLDVNWAFYQRS